MLLMALSACSPPDYRDVQGNQGRFVDLQGQWVLINYWATWCRPCREEIPELNALAMEQVDSIIVFGVNYDEVTIDELVSQIETMGIEFPVLREDPAGILGYPRPTVLPSTYLIDPGGKLARSLQGPQTRESIMSVIEESG